MNKRYIDFVPKKAAAPKVTSKKVMPEVRAKVAPKTATKSASKMATRPASKATSNPVPKVMPKTTPKAEKSASEPAKEAKTDISATEKKQEAKKLRLPSSKVFINTEKVEKRPLSKNVYKPRKIVVTPKEEPKGTVTIIEKPEKDSKMGLVVTIIITIILGAAAGTVAFLLLPK